MSRHPSSSVSSASPLLFSAAARLQAVIYLQSAVNQLLLSKSGFLDTVFAPISATTQRRAAGEAVLCQAALGPRCVEGGWRTTLGTCGGTIELAELCQRSPHSIKAFFSFFFLLRSFNEHHLDVIQWGNRVTNPRQHGA